MATTLAALTLIIQVLHSDTVSTPVLCRRLTYSRHDMHHGIISATITTADARPHCAMLSRN